MPIPTEESRAKKHKHAIRMLARTKNGKMVLDYLVQEAGFYKRMSSKDQKLQNDRVAMRDFVVKHIVEPLKTQEK